MDLLRCKFYQTISLFRRIGNYSNLASIQCLNPVIKLSVSDYVDVNLIE